MFYRDPPSVLRIKRKRDEDPLEALFLENSVSRKSKKTTSTNNEKRREDENIYFQLKETNEESNSGDESIYNTLVSEAGSNEFNHGHNNTLKKRRFLLPHNTAREDTFISNELSDMLSYLLKEERNRNGSTGSNTKRKTRSRSKTGEGTNGNIDNEISPYVYDVYHLTAGPYSVGEGFKIGYVQFSDDNDICKSDDESDKPINSDDEDSNAEDYYRNDYPSDEDAGIYSDTFTNNDNDSSFDLKDSSLGITTRDIDDDGEGFDALFYDIEGSNTDINLLADDEYDNEAFERQNFFEGEDDDELAIHRDRIFGRLQRLIDKR